MTTATPTSLTRRFKLKRLILAVSFLLICIGLCTFEQYTIESTYKETTAVINQAIEYTEKEDYSKAENACKKLAEIWDKKYPCLTAMVEHGVLDDAGITINSLEDMASQKNEALRETLIEAKNQIKAVRDNQKITFGNIF